MRELGDHVSSQEARNLSKLQGEFLILMLLCAFTWHTIALHESTLVPRPQEDNSHQWQDAPATATGSLRYDLSDGDIRGSLLCGDDVGLGKG